MRRTRAQVEVAYLHSLVISMICARQQAQQLAYDALRTRSLQVHARMQSTLSKGDRFGQRGQHSSLPRGFLVSSTYAGIKSAISPRPADASANSAKARTSVPKPDMALIVSSSPAAVAGTFTTNVFKAAPVVHATQALAEDGARTRAVLANSGCANAVTGKAGLEDTRELVGEVQRLLTPSGRDASGASAADVLMLSTGVIGVRLPLAPMKRALPHLVSGGVLQTGVDAWWDVARAYMTTDTFPKLRTREFELGGRRCSMAAIDKGAGMIHPTMSSPSGALHATLLGLIATDAPVAPAALQRALDAAVRVSFNCISVDGDMSTNDTILALANGQAPAAPGATLGEGAEMDESSHPAELARFREELTALCLEMAHLIVRDGEGAEKFVQVRVKNAPTFEHARAIASSISTSALVKCALHGEDANWGRILCAAGYAALPPTVDGTAVDWAIDPARVDVSFVPTAGSKHEDPLHALVDGVPQVVDEAHAARLLSAEDICIDVDLKGGTWGLERADKEALFWTCDLSKEYISINGDYRT